MNGADSVFLDLTPLSATTLFYLAALLAVALFFKFNRLLSIRNLDVLTLFAVMPGFLLLIRTPGSTWWDHWWGYVWLLGGSGYFLIRCLLDLVLERRPALAPNLNIGGLMWLAGALFLGLIAAPPRQLEGGFTTTAPVDAAVREGTQRALKDVPVPPSELERWVEHGLTMLCHLSIVVGLMLIGWRHFDDLHGGAAAATFYLLLPYAFVLMPPSALGAGRWDHALAMALMVWSVFTYRRPVLAGVFLGAAAGCVFFPVWTLPVWVSFYRGRGATRFAAAFAVAGGLCLAVIAAVLAINGKWPSQIQPMWTQPTWQPWYESQADSFWLGPYGQEIHWAYRIPVFILFFAFVLATLFWPAPKNLAHVLALSAAHLIGVQFWYPDQGGVYVLWYLPFLLLLVFRPNLAACQPPPVVADDWLAHRAQAVRRLLRRMLRKPEPAHVG